MKKSSSTKPIRGQPPPQGLTSGFQDVSSGKSKNKSENQTDQTAKPGSLGYGYPPLTTSSTFFELLKGWAMDEIQGHAIDLHLVILQKTMETRKCVFFMFFHVFSFFFLLLLLLPSSLFCFFFFFVFVFLFLWMFFLLFFCLFLALAFCCCCFSLVEWLLVVSLCMYVVFGYLAFTNRIS